MHWGGTEFKANFDFIKLFCKEGGKRGRKKRREGKREESKEGGREEGKEGGRERGREEGRERKVEKVLIKSKRTSKYIDYQNTQEYASEEQQMGTEHQKFDPLGSKLPI